MQRLDILKEIAFTNKEIKFATKFISEQVESFYKDDQEVIVLSVLHGATKFKELLFSKIINKSKFKHFDIEVKSYEGDKRKTDEPIVCLKNISMQTIRNKKILILDDIYETGTTLHRIILKLKEFHPKDIECAVLLSRNIIHIYDVFVRFNCVCTDIEDFVVGYGLDYDNDYRDLPFIAFMKKEEDFPEDSSKICLCNKCGETCKNKIYQDGGFNGLIEAKTRGGYTSDVLEDLTEYEFDLCEKCLMKLFDSFKIPVDKKEYCW
jgi:hypoxanthine phosphoribosyltransferase